MLECVVAQHEIDHLEGRLITDRRYTTTITRGKKYGRNERVMVKLSDGTTEFMKYKKANLYFQRELKSYKETKRWENLYLLIQTKTLYN